MQIKRGEEFLENLISANAVTNEENLKVIASEVDFEIDEITKDLKVLIIEDHNLIIESYELIFNNTSDSFPNYSFTIHIAKSCKEAILKLKGENVYDIILLDIRLPPYPEANIYSGEDISLWIDKKLSIRPKIIINTTFDDDYRLYNLYKNINPDGFLTKYDANSKLLSEAILTVLDSTTPFYSNKVLEMIRKNFTNKEILDDIDRKMLYLLSLGATVNYLVSQLPYGKTSVEKKKKALFEFLDVPDKDLRALIEEARRRGFI
ncbi:hypothetical protein [uncultured Dokdonia sp.]|uniref:hypothetical protein n=1 Tax=uncultured Dokdonia sp. TaxID=575653 RepID=UPI002625B6DB|nr:hypothetical protein [uncultured Dokdonia sp.]